MRKRPKLDLRSMLEYRRPARSWTEREFIARYIDTVPGMYADKYGNRILTGDGRGRVMISVHTDTVHCVPGKQRVSIRRGTARLAGDEALSNCLGADDTAGVYAALRMIEAGVQATFVFHRDEEIGGRGSDWLAREHADWVSQFDVCLALDRRGTGDVITAQAWAECASREFARSLAGELGMGHRPAEGVFTDSANYAHLIGECSNLSIGYAREHTRQESLDVEYLERVIEKLIAMDWARVEARRKPGTGAGWGWADTGADDVLVEVAEWREWRQVQQIGVDKSGNK